MANDIYKVRLEMQQIKSTEGRVSARYKIKEVLEFVPARLPYQLPLPVITGTGSASAGVDET